jgi:hypothetical protein
MLVVDNSSPVTSAVEVAAMCWPVRGGSGLPPELEELLGI